MTETCKICGGTKNENIIIFNPPHLDKLEEVRYHRDCLAKMLDCKPEEVMDRLSEIRL